MKRKMRFGFLVLLTLTLFSFVPQDSKISVDRIMVAEGIEDREPVGVNTSFTDSTEVVYCFTHIIGAQEETAITHRWTYADSLTWDVSLPVRSASWRTFSSKNLVSDWVGEWKVEVLDASDTIIAETTFSITD